MGAVHVRLHLEHQAGERRLDGAGAASRQLPRPRGRGEVDDGVQQQPYTDVGNGRAEEHGRGPARQERLLVVRGAGDPQQLQLLHRLVPVRAVLGRRPLGRDRLLDGLLGAAQGAGVAQHPPGRSYVDQAAQIPGVADRPGDGGGPEAELSLDLVQQLQGLTAGPVPFVDECDHGDAAVAADVEQLAGLLLQALGRVDEHHRAVHRGQDAVGVLGEVRVAGSVQQVEHAPAVGELQHGGGDRDAAGLLHLHPVRGHPTPPGLAVHRARPGDGVGVQCEGLGDRGLARVGMADHREGTPPRRLMGRRPSAVRDHRAASAPARAVATAS